MPEKKMRMAKGQGSFKHNPDGTVTMRKGVGIKADGNRKTLTVTAENEAKCIKLMQKKEAQWNREKNCNKVSVGITLEELCKRHLEYQVMQKELMPKSIDRREGTIRNQIGKYPFGKTQVISIKSSNIDDHINYLINETELSVSSIDKTVDVINAAYEWAISRGELDFNPVRQLKSSLSKKINKLEVKNEADADVKILSEDEMSTFTDEALATHPNGKHKYAGGLVCLLLLYTGMRCGEAFGLRWRDYDRDNGLLTINKSISVAKNRDLNKKDTDSNYISIEGGTKNKKARTIQLFPEAQKILEKIRLCSEVPHSIAAADDYIIKTRSGRNNTASNLGKRADTIYRNCGFSDDISGLHILRRTFATRRYEEGWRTKDIAAYIGDLESTTEKYYIAIRKKMHTQGEIITYVPIPRVKEQN